MLDVSFIGPQHSSEGGWGEKHKIVQIAVFLIIFVTDCLKNLQNFQFGILQLLILNHIGGTHLPISETFNIFAFSMVLFLFSLHLMEIFPITHRFWKKILLSTA